MQLSKPQLIIIGVAVIIIAGFIGLFFIGGGGGQEKIKLTILGIDDENAVKGLTEEYRKLRPNAEINYQKFNSANYEKDLVNALAADYKADIIFFHGAWLNKHIDKIIPAPENQFSLTQLRQSFPAVIEQNFVSDGKVYALPLYLDTLAFLYNKDFMDAKSVAIMPSRWEDLQKLVPQLRVINASNQLTKAAAAIGGSEKSVDNGSDLLNLLMLQYDSLTANKQSKQFDFGRQAVDAFRFYLQFANPLSPYFTWHDAFGNSITKFANREVAVIFNYASVIPEIKKKNPYLNLGVAPMLQLAKADQPINYPDYWGLAVVKQSQSPSWAWDFIAFATTNKEISQAYLKNVQRPPALRVLINQNINDPVWGVFAEQALTARSWPQPDRFAIKQIFSNMIELVLTGKLTLQQALDQGRNEINGLYR